MGKIRFASLLPVIGLVAACANGTVGPDKGRDRDIDQKDLSQLQAGIWVDPNGCDHWIIDDGIEGYLTPRLDRRGKPVCSGIAPPTVVTGPFKSGSSVADTL
ncbi:MAG: hypothetical protein H5U15_05865 [Roseovarius sp.]|jgi:hypothetical protein|nr:hypothetical protein [Roseovarius sp.]